MNQLKFMSDKIEKQKKDLEISLGLLVGYIIAASINMFAFDKSFEEAFSQMELIYGFVGVTISVFFIVSLRRKQKNKKD